MRTRWIPLSLALAAATSAAPAAAQAPPGLPGPPPGAGASLPSAPGTAPAIVPPGTALTIPPAGGPGLLADTHAALAARRFNLRFACQTGGTLRVRASRLSPRSIAADRFACRSGRATARLIVSRKIARRLERRRTVAAVAIVGKSRLHLTLSARRTKQAAKGFWTDGHLECAPGYLVEPDFTTKQPTPISTRGWVAVYTAATGWHWYGTQQWNTWTATSTGVTQFHPGGAVLPVPWTVGPITVPPGQNAYAIGVYEIVYWVGGRPDHQWQYVNAGTTGAVAAGSPTPYCVYP
jgi:hypothetical protein